MPITEAIMAQGAFTVDLANIPADLRDIIAPYGRIIIRRGRPSTLVGVDAASLRAEADFVGVLISHRISLGGISLHGYGLASLLTDGEGRQADGYYALLGVQTLTRFCGYVVEGTGGDPANTPTTGLTLGTVNTTYASSTVPFQWAPTLKSAREALTFVAGYWGLEWRVNTDGTVDVGTVDELYGAPSKLVASQPLPGSTDADAFVMDGLSVEYDSSQWASGVAIQDPVTNVTLAWASNTDEDIVGIDGTAVRRIAYYEPPTGYDPESSTYPADLTTWCANKLAELQTPRRIISIDGIRQAVVYDVGSGQSTGLTCGEWVWVWAPGVAPIDSTARVNIGGQTLTPIAVRVASLTRPITEGMGVIYEAPDGSSGTLYDLTPYVVWESDDGVQIG